MSRTVFYHQAAPNIPIASFPRRAVVLILLTALLVRGVALALFPVTHLSTNAEIAYLGGAERILSGHGLSDPTFPVFTPPLYAILISGLKAILGMDQLPVKIVQIFGDTIATAIIYLIAREIFDVRVALGSAGLWAVYPFAVYPTLYIGTEALFTLFVAITLLLLIKAISGGSAAIYAWAGVTLGIATLIRGATQFVPLWMLLVMVASYRMVRPQIIRGYVILCLAFGLALLPWAIRNYVVCHEFIPVATGGSVFLQGSAEEFLTIDGKTVGFPKHFEKLKEKGIPQPPTGSSPLEGDRFYLRAGIEKYKEQMAADPLSLLRFIGLKFMRLWYATESGANHGVILGINSVFYLFGLVGVWLSCQHRQGKAVILLVTIGYFAALHWVSLPLFRYMVPVMPYVIIFVAYAVVVLWDRRKLQAPQSNVSSVPSSRECQ